GVPRVARAGAYLPDCPPWPGLGHATDIDNDAGVGQCAVCVCVCFCSPTATPADERASGESYDNHSLASRRRPRRHASGGVAILGDQDPAMTKAGETVAVF